MKIAMISQPMNGISEEEIKETRDRAKKFLESKGYKVEDTYIHDNPGLEYTSVNNISLYYLGESLKRMSKCDIVYFCEGWQDARGCKIEHQVAKEYGLKIVYETLMKA